MKADNNADRTNFCFGPPFHIEWNFSPKSRGMQPPRRDYVVEIPRGENRMQA